MKKKLKQVGKVKNEKDKEKQEIVKISKKKQAAGNVKKK